MLTRRLFPIVSSLLLAGSLAVACSTASDRETFPSDKDAGPSGNNTSSGGGITDKDGGLGEGSGPKATIEGKTYAPNGDLKLGEVLVYWTSEEPAEIPEQAYCDTCVQLPAGTFTTSAADGSFSLDIPVERDLWLVTQKGQFRRVRKINLEEGQDEVDDELTTLPSRSDSSDGDTVPKIGIVTGTYDKINVVLEELGIEEMDTVPKSDLSDAEALKAYHILLLPCDMVGDTCGNPTAQRTEVKEALQDFVRSGGKVYASDYSYEYVNQAFPDFITFKGDGSPGAGCGGPYTSNGRYDDEGLAAWMNAIGEEDIQFHGNYSDMLNVNTVQGPDENGDVVDLTPKIWATSTSKVGSSEQIDQPATVSIPYGCGRALFSTFHTESTPDATAQKRALLYVLLGVSACIGEPGGIH